MCRRAGGLDSSQALQRCSCAIFKNPWMCTSLLQQSHKGAIVTMSNLLMNLWQTIGDLISQMNLDSHRLHVALPVAVLAVAHQLHDQLPFLTLCSPSQSVFRCWRRKELVAARQHQDANVPECTKRNANCLSRGTVSPASDTGIAETVMMIHWKDRSVCRVCVLVTNSMIQNSLNVERSGQNLSRSIQWTSLRVAQTPGTTVDNCFHHLLGHTQQRILCPTRCTEWLRKMNMTTICLHSRNHGCDSIQFSRHTL